MSTIIGLCGENYCFLASDSRRVAPNADGDWVVVDDDFDKVFRINDAVLFGATGRFWPSESICDPISNLPQESENISLLNAVEAAESHMVKNLIKIISCRRQYIIAGREPDGGFCIVTVSLNDKEHRVERHVYRAEAPGSHAAVLALPDALSDRASSDAIMNILRSEIVKCKTVDEVHALAANVIRIIAKSDQQKTVGGQIKIYPVS